MRANYKMQRLFVPQDLAAGCGVRGRPGATATIWRTCCAWRRAPSCWSSTGATANGWRGSQAKTKKAVRLEMVELARPQPVAPDLLLLLRAAEGRRGSTISRAEGGGDGRWRAAARHHPAHAARQAGYRSAAGQRDRGGRAMRHPRRSRGRATPMKFTALLAGWDEGPAADLLRRERPRPTTRSPPCRPSPRRSSLCWSGRRAAFPRTSGKKLYAPALRDGHPARPRILQGRLRLRSRRAGGHPGDDRRLVRTSRRAAPQKRYRAALSPSAVRRGPCTSRPPR